MGVELVSLKYITQDKDDDYKNLLDDQYINHFQNNKEITSKSFLTMNLKNHLSSELPTHSFFPRSYDFSSPEQVKYFKMDFFTTVLLEILKEQINYFKKAIGERIFHEQVHTSYLKYTGKDKEKGELKGDQNKFNRKIFLYKEYGVNEFMEISPHCQEFTFSESVEIQKKMVTNPYLLDECLDFYRCLYQQLTSTQEKKDFFSINSFSRSSLKRIYKFSRYSPPYSKEAKKKMGFMKQYWKPPSKELIFQLYLYHQTFENLIPQIYNNSERKNLWIVKPASNARGQGIKVMNKLKDILPKKERGNKGRDIIVMKYLEKPLLYQVKEKYYKFDIRQWVLVTSFQPLEIWIFGSFYGRMCSKEYKLSDFEDTAIHLSNYSVNKSFFKKNNRKKSVDLADINKSGVQKEDNSNPVIRNASMAPLKHNKFFNTIDKQETENQLKKSIKKKKRKISKGKNDKLTKSQSVISSKDLKEYIKNKYSVGFNEKILPTIEQLIITTIKACRKRIKHRERSFEIYGFDIILDENLNPWLLEVNLSPACAARSKFLSKMLKYMSLGLFKLLAKKEKKKEKDFLKKKEAYKNWKAKSKELKKLLELKEEISTEMKKGFEGSIKEKWGETGVDIYYNKHPLLKQANSIKRGREKPTKFMSCFENFSEKDEDFEKLEKDFKWKKIYKEGTKESKESVYNKGQKGFLIIEGKPMDEKNLIKADYFVKSNW